MNPATFRRKPIVVPALVGIVALALSVAACGPSNDETAADSSPASTDATPRIDNDDDGVDHDDADDRAISATERASAEKAALAAVGTGTVISVEASDDRGVAYDVDVRTPQGVEWDVDLDAQFAVVSKVKDN
jgi:uncharacterized membrane protein YkoI